MLPNFLILGAQKSGTTSIYKVLSKHQQIFFPKVKELNFFYFEHEHKKGIEYYKRFFTGSENFLARGEASPGYICGANSAKWISETIPDCKLIICVRNPIDRAYSQYYDNLTHLNENKTFEEAVNVYLKHDNPPKGYFVRGHYFEQISYYLKYFDRNQMLILPFDALITNAKEFYDRILSFLELDEFATAIDYWQTSNASSVHENFLYRYFYNHPEKNVYLNKAIKKIVLVGKKKSLKKPKMNEETRNILREYYQPHNENLSRFLGLDLSHWK